MLKRLLIVISVILISIGANSQDNNFDSWNKNYPEMDFNTLIQYETDYADSIELNSTSQYYARIDKYSFIATYLGENRPLVDSIFKSMKRVFKLRVGNTNQLDGLVYNEYKFQIGNHIIWMPIQTQLEKSLKKEIKKGKQAKLYCLFFNEHGGGNKLYNIFLISEFQKIR